MIGICQVCGSPLEPPVVLCPTCETPHHEDCWEYNRGCSVYGCTAMSAVMPRTARTPLAVREPPRPESLWKTLSLAVATATAAMAVVWSLAGEQLAVLVGFPLAVTWVCWTITSLPLVREAGPTSSSQELERKAVLAALAAGHPDQLAHAYALFQQRHPREPFDSAQQRRIAAELIGAGHRMLGLEAVEKALRQPGRADDPSMGALRRRALLADPAFLADALELRHPSPDDRWMPVNVDLFRACATAGADSPVDLLSVSARGFNLATRHLTKRARRASTFPPEWGGLIAGPIDPQDASELGRRALDSGCPAIPLPTTVVASFPRSVEMVQAAHLSQTEARFLTATQERIVPWRFVQAIVHARIEPDETRRDTDEESDPAALLHETWRVTPSPQRAAPRPIVEIVVEPGPVRLRIDELGPKLFEYLGRRRDPLPWHNLVILTKDLVRFGRACRASHGVRTLLDGTTSPGGRFRSLSAFDEYVCWFWAMGTGRVHDLLDPVLARLLKEEA